VIISFWRLSHPYQLPQQIKQNGFSPDIFGTWQEFEAIYSPLYPSAGLIVPWCSVKVIDEARPSRHSMFTQIAIVTFRAHWAVTYHSTHAYVNDKLRTQAKQSKRNFRGRRATDKMQRDKNRRGETLREVAESFGVSYDTVWRASKNGTLKTILLGNRKIVPAAEIERIEREGFELKAS
jgi:hypothetical protein